LIKPPNTPEQMRDLCSDIIEQGQGPDSASVAVMNTALQLWTDQNLVNALQNNPTFQNAKERIQTLTSHLLPQATSNTGETCNNNNVVRIARSPSGSRIHHTNPRLFDPATADIINEALEDVFQCPSCGQQVHCSHVQHTTSSSLSSSTTTAAVSTLTEQEEFNAIWDELNNEKNSAATTTTTTSTATRQLNGNSSPNTMSSDDDKETRGSVGSVPDDFEDEDGRQNAAEFSEWFGPLVLASLAVIGLALGVFNGEIVLPRLKTLSARTLAALTVMLQASNSMDRMLEQSYDF